jgi:hypothetical protein
MFIPFSFGTYMVPSDTSCRIVFFRLSIAAFAIRAVPYHSSMTVPSRPSVSELHGFFFPQA